MIILTYDHGGYEIMLKIKKYLDNKKLEYIDVNGKFDSTDSYVEYGAKANKKVVESKDNIGIYMCRSGIGMTMVANRTKGVRAANCIDTTFAKMARLHNNANVCVLPSDYIDYDTMISIIDTFLNTEFEGGRHETRVKALDEIE